MKKVVVVLVLMSILLVACAQVTEAELPHPPTVKDEVTTKLRFLPIGEYPAKGLFCSYNNSYWGNWTCSILADPTKTGIFRLYIVSPEYLSVVYGENDGYVTVKYEEVTLHIPK